MAKREIPRAFLVPVGSQTTRKNHIWDGAIPRSVLCGYLVAENYEPAVAPRPDAEMCTLCLRQLVQKVSYVPLLEDEGEDSPETKQTLDQFLRKVRDWDDGDKEVTDDVDDGAVGELGDLEYQPCADGREHLIYRYGDSWRTLCGDLDPEILSEDDERARSTKPCPECSDIRHDRAAAGLGLP